MRSFNASCVWFVAIVSIFDFESWLPHPTVNPVTIAIKQIEKRFLAKGNLLMIIDFLVKRFYGWSVGCSWDSIRLFFHIRE
jgi:hypothetical protein